MTPGNGTPPFLYFPEILQTWEDSSPSPADLLTSGTSTTTISECPHVLRMVPARLSGQHSPCQPHITAWIPALGECSAPLTAISIYWINERREDFPSIPLWNISATLQTGYYYLKQFEDSHQLTEPHSSTSFCPTPEPLLSSDAQRAPFNEGDWGEATCVWAPPYSGQDSGSSVPVSSWHQTTAPGSAGSSALHLPGNPGAFVLEEWSWFIPPGGTAEAAGRGAHWDPLCSLELPRLGWCLWGGEPGQASWTGISVPTTPSGQKS